MSVEFEIGPFVRRMVVGGLAAAAVSVIGMTAAPTASAGPITPCTYKLVVLQQAHYDKETGVFTPYKATYVKVCP